MATTEINSVVGNIKMVCQKFGLKTPDRIRGREMSFQSDRREHMSVRPGGTLLDSRERDMVVCG